MDRLLVRLLVVAFFVVCLGFADAYIRHHGHNKFKYLKRKMHELNVKRMKKYFQVETFDGSTADEDDMPLLKATESVIKFEPTKDKILEGQVENKPGRKLDSDGRNDLRFGKVEQKDNKKIDDSEELKKHLKYDNKSTLPILDVILPSDELPQLNRTEFQPISVPTSFDDYDKNGDGFLTLDEFIKETGAAENVANAFAASDFDGDRKLNHDEFLRAPWRSSVSKDETSDESDDHIELEDDDDEGDDDGDDDENAANSDENLEGEAGEDGSEDAGSDDDEDNEEQYNDDNEEDKFLMGLSSTENNVAPKRVVNFDDDEDDNDENDNDDDHDESDDDTDDEDDDGYDFNSNSFDSADPLDSYEEDDVLDSGNAFEDWSDNLKGIDG